MSKKWREFEKLVARIEKLLSPQGAIVKSPDRIKDKITGQEREVDVSIRFKLGSVEILITIECRDRKSISDDIWLEQLATKKLKIGASHTIAVSSTRFTKSARRSAEFFGIELRVVKDITDKQILAWLGRIKITNEIGQVGLERITIKVYDDACEDIELAPQVIEEIEKDKLQAKIFYIERDNAKVTILSLLNFLAYIDAISKGDARKIDVSNKIVLSPGDRFDVELKPGFMNLFDNTPANKDGLARIKVFKFSIVNKAALIETINGPKYVKEVEIELALARKIQEIHPSRTIQYADTIEPISHVVETEFELFNSDNRKEYILSYPIPKDENGPVLLQITEKDQE